uniref:Thioredoxin domain-containing protein n=1 Tax=Timema genevievae TaxID=629358 RepID=A0A7R9PSB3_TIMGE|nr:unnamed protein product [Timema genevievae]
MSASCHLPPLQTIGALYLKCLPAHHHTNGRVKVILSCLCFSRWCVLFSHPADFTPVCTTELGRIAQRYYEFTKRNVKLLGHSCDSLEKHRIWIQDIRAYQRDVPAEFPYPVIADESRELAVRLDMLDEDATWDVESSDAVRALYVVGPDRQVKLAMFYPNTTGRNIDEILRVVDSLQLTYRLKVSTPVDWQMGEDVMLDPAMKTEEANKSFPGGVEVIALPSGIAYVRKTSDYTHANECWDGPPPS